jgi:hypothetical protein
LKERYEIRWKAGISRREGQTRLLERKIDIMHSIGRTYTTEVGLYRCTVKK